MNSPVIPGIFILVVCLVSVVFLWKVILPITQQQLKVEDQSTAKYFLLVVSLVLFGLIVHSGYDVMNDLFNFNSPL